ncbi:hypothetical protein CLU79DRAFT_754386, partial [Phycomyces nitens]
MLATHLPYDILTTIAEYLSCNDSRECSSTCKAWWIPFRKYAWRSIVVHNRIRLKHICNVIETETDFSLETNYFVQILDFGCHVIVSNKIINILQHQFQNVKYLTVPNGKFDGASFGLVADWSRWKYLEHLELTTPSMKSITEFNNVFEALSLLDNLSNLSLNGHTDGNNVMTWNHLDIIHEYLPKLKKLQLAMHFSPISTQDLAKIRQSKPAVNITQTNFHILHTTSLWLFYFTCKYPNMEYFSWGDGIKSDEQLEHWELVMPMFYNLDTMFPRLVNIFLNCSGSNTKSPYSYFWKLINRFKAPLKNVCYSTNCDKTVAHPESSLIECLQACSTTMVTLYYGNNTRSQTINKSTITFIMCPRLVDLCLEFFDSHVSLDSILDNCPALKKLVLKCRLLFLSKDAAKNSSVPHCLKSIILTQLKTTTSVFNYLSLRCKELDTMRLKYIRIRGPVSPTTGNLSIDMPFTQFKVLRIVHSTFSLHKDQYDLNNADDDESRHKHDIQLINLLTIQYTDTLGISNVPDKSITQLPTEILPERILNQIWFHFHLDLSKYTPGSIAYQMTAEEVQYAQTHFESFQEMNRSLLSNSSPTPKNYRWRPKRSWKYDLLRGRVLL